MSGQSPNKIWIGKHVMGSVSVATFHLLRMTVVKVSNGQSLKPEEVVFSSYFLRR